MDIKRYTKRKNEIIFSLLIVLAFTPSIKLLSQPTRPSISIINGTIPKGFYFMVPYKIKQAKGIQKLPIMVFNENGEILFYQYIDLVGDFKLHPNGIMSYSCKSKIYLMKDYFKVFDSISCNKNIETDPHDFLILKNGHYVLLGYEFQTEDYSKYNFFLNKKKYGSKKASVKYGVIQEFDEQKKLVFNWSTKNKFRVRDVDPFFLFDSLNVDFTHLNSVDADEEGDFIVSPRYFNEVFKVQKSTGNIVWRLGGKQNNFTFLNDTLPFVGQHDAKFTSKNTFTLFDNGFNKGALKHAARALEYEINDSAKTAKVIWSYSNPKKIISEGNGSVQSLPNDLMLINYGKTEKGSPNITFEIINKTDNKQLAEVYFKDTLGTYRTFYYAKLPFELLREEITVVKKKNTNELSLSNKHARYIWNTGERTATINTRKTGAYYVYYSDDGKRFFCSKILNL